MVLNREMENSHRIEKKSIKEEDISLRGEACSQQNTHNQKNITQ